MIIEHNSGEHSLTAVECTDVESLRHAIKMQVPLLVRGLVNNWPLEDWSFNKLKEVYGDSQVMAMVDLPKRTGRLLGGQELHERHMAFKEFCELVSSGPEKPCYLAYQRLNSVFAGAQEALQFDDITQQPAAKGDTRLWIGSAETCSGLHSDLKDNLFLQIVGRKKVLLVPFDDTKNVYPFTDNVVNSRVDPEAPWIDKYPNFGLTRRYWCEVSPGEILFIPKGWWHYLRSETASVSVNHWFGDGVTDSQYWAKIRECGIRYASKAVLDCVSFAVSRRSRDAGFFFSPKNNGERLYDLVRGRGFSFSNDPMVDSNDS